jgi:hypothetical protein
MTPSAISEPFMPTRRSALRSGWVRAVSDRLRIAGHGLLACILFFSLGGHLALLQTVAWGTMLVNFSRHDSFTEAAKKTFDGEHPCPMCKIVKKSRKSEEKKPLLKTESKMEVALPAVVHLKMPRSICVETAVPDYLGRGLWICLDVPLRPPKVA